VRWGLVLLAALLLAGARAGRVEVIQADRLELRKVEGHELVILYGRPVKIRLEDGRQVEADVVEYDRDARRLLLLGNVLYVDDEKRVIESDQLELYLNDESMDALEVHMRRRRPLGPGGDAGTGSDLDGRQPLHPLRPLRPAALRLQL